MFSFHSYGENNSYNDFKVAGISLFDDLYDHLSPKQVREKSKGFEDYYEDLKDPYKFTTLGVENHPTINKKYENVEISFKNEEGRLIIHSISSGDFYTDIDNCLQDKAKLVAYVNDKLSNTKKQDIDPYSHSADPSGKSKVHQTLFLHEKFEIEVSCYDWDEEVTKLKGWTDNLSFGIDSKKFSNWLRGF